MSAWPAIFVASEQNCFPEKILNLLIRVSELQFI